MITLTKEWLQQKIADMEATRDEIPFGLDEDDSNTLAALRIALASLEAEPVGTFRKGPCGYSPSFHEDAVPLYTSPPAPVSVPDEATPENIEILASTFAPRGVTYQWDKDECNAAADSWNAGRAAMLQGADGNSPDGWVACSERMPDSGTEIFYFCQDDGLRDCGIVSSANFSDKGDAQLYVHAEGYDLRFGVDITHRMPLPAAPQQEDTNEE